jgi:filamentous hemagglutinin family protein
MKPRAATRIPDCPFGQALARATTGLLGCLLFLGSLYPESALGQIATNQGLVVRDDSLGLGKGQVVPPGTDPLGGSADYLIAPDLGQPAGSDTLLHSFRDFSVGTGEVATFTGPSSVQHIVGRVTGNGTSNINGTIRSTIQGADLYMLNPNGFVFGENALLDVRGSFHVSSADYIRWDDQVFEASPGGLVPTLAFADPVAFGFLDPAPAEMRFENAFPLAVDEGRTLSVIGGDIMLDPGELEAAAGTLQVVSVGSEGEVVMDALDDVQASFTSLGAITLNDFARIQTSGDGGGAIVIRGDSLKLAGTRSSILAITFRGLDGGGIDIAVEDLEVSGDFSRILSSTSGAGKGGSIRLEVDRLEIRNGGLIASNTNGFALPNAGAAGTIDVNARAVTLRSGGRIESSTAWSGAGGLIDVTATESVEISGFGTNLAKSGIYAFVLANGPGGTIKITSPDLALSNVAEIVAENRGAGLPGAIDLIVDRLSLQGGARVSAQKLGSGAGANITITASDSVVIEGIVLDPTNDVLSSTGISTVAFQSATGGKAGDISINAPDLVIRDAAIVLSGTVGAAPGGSITANVERLILDTGGRLDAGKFGTAAGGEIAINATESVSIGGFHTAFPCAETLCYSGIFTTAGGDDAANPAKDMTITTPLFEFTDGGWISAGTVGAPDSGAIQINVDTLVMRANTESGEGARIETRTLGTGQGGIVDIKASRLVDVEGSIIETDGEPMLSGGSGGGSAGDLSITAPTIRLRDAAVTSQNTDIGDGGDVTLTAGRLIDARGSTISAKVDGANAQGGDVILEAGSLIALLEETEVRTNAPEGSGGDITITTPVLIRSSDSVIDATGLLEGGEITINSPQQIVVDQATPLPAEFLDASSMMLASCDARRGGDRAGSFTVTRWRGLPLSPEGPMLAFEPIGSRSARSIASKQPLQPPPAGTDAADPGEPAAASQQLAYAALEQGGDAFRGGSLETATRRWQEASQAAAQASDVRLEGDALRGLGQTEQLRGEYAASIEPLEEALALARRSGDHTREAAALGSLGNAHLALREPAQASRYLDEALSLARAAGNSALAAALLNNRGNQHATTGAYAEALEVYLKSAQVAGGLDDPLLAAQALGNAAHAALELERGEKAADLLARAHTAAQGLPLSREGLALQIHLARTHGELAQRSAAHWRQSMQRAHGSLLRASDQAALLGDLRSLSYARGNLAALYELEGRHQEALQLTREALAHAERAEAPDLTARWQGQTGAILWAAGEREAAIEYYRRAVDLIEETRPELRARYGALDTQFQREVEPLYLALVDALLQQAGDAGAPAHRLRLAEARTTVERWKTAELRDYFRDECVAELEARAAPAEALSQTAAVVYPILLPNRLELLISGAWGIERHTVDVGAEQITVKAREFRRLLANRTQRRYLRPARQLHEWLVAPYAASLERRGVDTLVFVPGGALRTIPMAALHDGERFVIERFAVATTPSLQLLAPEPLEPGESRLLLAGVSESVQDFPALKSVPTELSAIHELYGGELLLDEDFELARLETSLRERRPEVVHLASHATFTGDPTTSFLLTHDTKLTMDGLSELVGAGRFGEEPLELLVLSACATAAGDDRAALGLSGVAVRAGARSALGSLWSVSDRASSELIVRFYRELGQPGLSKAQALQHAQQELLASPGFEHPFYWAPFLVINNWL